MPEKSVRLNREECNLVLNALTAEIERMRTLNAPRGCRKATFRELGERIQPQVDLALKITLQLNGVKSNYWGDIDRDTRGLPVRIQDTVCYQDTRKMETRRLRTRRAS